MANSEACQLYIEQQIEEGLEEGKTPYYIGKDLAVWIEKLFEVKIAPRTIEQRARRQDATNVASTLTPENSREIEENQEFKWGGKREKAGRPPKFKCVEPVHRTSFTGENEWYTPVKYVDAARDVMGGIDIDPATSEFGQSRIRAKQFFSCATDGLTKEWNGRLWLNPPYSQPLMSRFIEKVVEEFNQKRVSTGIILTHNYTDTRWFHSLEAMAELICFTLGRIPYEKSNGEVASPTQGAAFFYLGDNPRKFREVFGGFGFIR